MGPEEKEAERIKLELRMLARKADVEPSFNSWEYEIERAIRWARECDIEEMVRHLVPAMLHRGDTLLGTIRAKRIDRITPTEYTELMDLADRLHKLYMDRLKQALESCRRG